MGAHTLSQQHERAATWLKLTSVAGRSASGAQHTATSHSPARPGYYPCMCVCVCLCVLLATYSMSFNAIIDVFACLYVHLHAKYTCKNIFVCISLWQGCA